MELNGRAGGADPPDYQQPDGTTRAIEALKSLQPGRTGSLYSDSQLLVRTMTQGWERKANLDLWAQLDELAKLPQVS